MAGNPCNIIPDQEIVLEGGAQLVPAPEASDAGKVLGVTNQEGGIGWVEAQGGTVDQTYNASSTNAQSGTAVAEALGSSSTLAAGNGVSLTESSGTLTIAADVDNVTIGFDSTTHKIKSLQTVDQTYNAASSNAQSGTAVAQAIASIPSSSYTAGDGIEISNDKIAVRAGKNLDFANALVATPLYSPVREYASYHAYSFIGQMTITRLNQLRQGMTIKMHSTMQVKMNGSTGGAHFAICLKNSDNTPNLSGNVVLVADAALSTDTSSAFRLDSGNTYVADFSSLSEKSVGSFNDINDDNVDQFYLTVISYATEDAVSAARYINGLSYEGPYDVNTSEYYTESPSIKELVAVDQLPSFSSADSGKVLQVQPNGTLAWVTLS